MESDAITLGQVVRQYRKARRFSQETLAYESGVNRTHLSHVERGVKQLMIPTLYKLAHALGVPASAILESFEKVSGLHLKDGENEWIDLVKQVDHDLQEFIR